MKGERDQLSAGQISEHNSDPELSAVNQKVYMVRHHGIGDDH